VGHSGLRLRVTHGISIIQLFRGLSNAAGWPQIHHGPVMLTIAPVAVAEPRPPPSGEKKMQLTFTESLLSGVTFVRLQLNAGLRVPLNYCAA
jgi:hypothetical protein